MNGQPAAAAGPAPVAQPVALVPSRLARPGHERAFEEVRLVIAGRWTWLRNPLTGQFLAAYQEGPKGKATLHWGPHHQARLVVPVIPGQGVESATRGDSTHRQAADPYVYASALRREVVRICRSAAEQIAEYALVRLMSSGAAAMRRLSVLFSAKYH
jgi:hypothetical protein